MEQPELFKEEPAQPKRRRLRREPQEWQVMSLRECPVPESLIQIKCPEDAMKYWKLHIASAPSFHADCEQAVVLILNTRLRIRGHYLVSIGTINETIANPREIFRVAVMAAAHCMILMKTTPAANRIRPLPTGGLPADCRSGGNVLDFVARMENCDAQEAAIRMNEWFNLNLDKQPPPPRDDNGRQGGANAPQAAPLAPPTGSVRESALEIRPQAEAPAEEEGPNTPLKFALKDLQTDHPYIAERGLTPETAKEFGLGHCKRGTMSGRIVIPIHNADGELVGYAGRWPGDAPEKRPKYKLPEGFKKMSEVFSLHRALREMDGSPFIVVEGFFDAMRLWQIGWRRTVSLMGSHLSATHERLLADAAQTCGVILLLDEDDAGRAGRAKALLRLATKVFVKVIPLPREGAQPDDLTEDELKSLLA